MKRLLLLVGLIFCATHAHASTCATLSSGASQSSIQAALNSCGSGNTLAFGAGSYSISSTLTWPCGVSITGPTVPLQAWPVIVSPTATITNTAGTAFAFQYPSGCNVTGVVFQYMELAGNPSGGVGGGGISIGSLGSSGGAGPTIQYNWIHGMQANAANYEFQSNNGVFIGTSVATNSSTLASSTWSNLTIQYNKFGSGITGSATSGDCSNNQIYQTFFYPYTSQGTGGDNYNNIGGYCNGVELYANTSNLNILHNSFQHVEQGIKFLEPGSNSGQIGCTGSYLSGAPNQLCHNNANVNYNDFANIHRIAIEAQQTPNTVMNFFYNSWHDCVNCGYGSWIWSLPQSGQSDTCPGGVACTNYTNANYSVEVGNQPQVTLYSQAGGLVPGNEYWGNGVENYNFGQGNISCLIHWGYTQTGASYSNNSYQGTAGQVQCTEEGVAAPPGPNTNNTNSSTIAALTSVSPTVSPAGGSFGTSQVVTFTNPGTNRDANTGIWYTTDGTTPIPGSGTAKRLDSGQTITLTSTTTLKVVGMWGALNQPTSYASGYGYVPSSVATYTFTGGTPTTAQPVISPASGSYTTGFSATITDSSPSPTIYYTTNGSTPTTSSPVYTGAISISGATTTVQAIATSSGLATSPVASNTYTYVAPPTISSCVQSNSTPACTATYVNTLTVGGTEQQEVCGTYTDGSTHQIPYGTDTITAWGSSSTSIITVGAIGSAHPGLVTGVSAGTANSTATVNGTLSCSVWGWTVNGTAPTLSSATMVTLAGGTTVAVGGTQTMCVNLAYTSPVENTQVCGSGTDTYGTVVNTYTSSSTSNATIVSSTGVLTGVAVGNTTVAASVNSGVYSPSLVMTVTAAPTNPAAYINGATNFHGSVVVQ